MIFGLVVGIAVLAWLLLRYWRRRRLLNPDYAFPCLAPTDPPHEFRVYQGISCCGRCGGGRKHPIHRGGPWPLPAKRRSKSASADLAGLDDGATGERGNIQ